MFFSKIAQIEPPSYPAKKLILKKVTEQLKMLIDADDVDSIFFLSPGQASLIKHVTDALGIFKSKINVIIPRGESSGLDLRLDSRLYLYQLHDDDDKVTLYESYQIR